MSLLANLATDSTIADEKDSVGSGGVLNSALYAANITLAYLQTAASGAMALALRAKTEDDREIRQTLWMTSGKEKGCKNYYEKDGEKHYLPGFLLANSVSLLTVGKELSQLDLEEKVVKLYSPEAKTEVPTKVQVFTELLEQPILIGLIKQTVDKTAKNDAGVYVPTGETREENEVDKFFRAKDRMTTSEIRGQAAEASFVDVWTNKWTDKVRNKVSGKSGTAGAPKAAAAAGGTKKPTTSLFA